MFYSQSTSTVILLWGEGRKKGRTSIGWTHEVNSVMTAGTGQLFVFVLVFSSLSVCVQVQDAVYCLIKNKVLTTETKVKGSSSPGICRVFYFKIKVLI